MEKLEFQFLDKLTGSAIVFFGDEVEEVARKAFEYYRNTFKEYGVMQDDFLQQFDLLGDSDAVALFRSLVESVQMKKATEQEALYAKKQSTQISGQTGYVGCMHVALVRYGGAVSFDWELFNADLCNDAFEKDLDGVMDAMRADPLFDGILSSGEDMQNVCELNESALDSNSGCYVFRINTPEYAYMLSCNTQQMTAEIHCYFRKWFERHLDKSSVGVRILGAGYKELFRVPDGGAVVVHHPSGDQTYICRYIDETHLEVGDNLYHSMEFADRLSRNGSTIEAVKSLV